METAFRNDDGSLDYVAQGTSYIWQFMIQEQWFFDKKHSTMQVRIVAMAPVFFNLFDDFGQRLAPTYQKHTVYCALPAMQKALCHQCSVQCQQRCSIHLI